MSAEFDLYHSLSDGLAVEPFVERLKTAGWKDLGKDLLRQGLQKAPEIGAAGLGAGIGGLGSYLMAKPGKNGEPSVEQKATRWANKGVKEEKKKFKETGTEPGFKQGIRHAVTPAAAGVADVMAKHPGKVGLMFAPAGAMAGLRILKALK